MYDKKGKRKRKRRKENFFFTYHKKIMIKKGPKEIITKINYQNK
jgi:hypothetical protein